MTELLIVLSVLFVIAGPLLLLAHGLRLPVVPALIIAGIIGGAIIELQFDVGQDLLLELAQIGIALLVFVFGVRIKLEDIRTILADSELVAVIQVAGIGLIGTGLGMLIGLGIEQAIFVGITAAFSSTIVGTALADERRNTNLLRNRIARSVQFVQDLIAVLIVLLIGAAAADTLSLDIVATELGYGVILLGGAVIFNQAIFPGIVWLAGDSDESLLIGMIALLVAFLASAELIGISIVVGAFAAGIAIQYDPVGQINVYNGLDSISDFFAAVLFITVGSLVSVPTVEVVIYTAAIVLLTVVFKPAITILLLLYQGYESRSATLAGLRLDQVSEFSLIIAIEAFVLGLLIDGLFEAVILAAAITMIISSFTQYYDETIYQTLQKTGVLDEHHGKVNQWSQVPDDLSDHIIIVGYGRQGRRIVEACEESDRQYVVVENDPAMLDDLQRECSAYVFGDAVESYTWQKARIEDARIVVSTVDSPPVNQYLVQFTDDIDVILRTDDVRSAATLLESGAIYVSVSDLLAADRLSEVIGAIITGEVSPEQLREQETGPRSSRTIYTGAETADIK